MQSFSVEYSEHSQASSACRSTPEFSITYCSDSAAVRAVFEETGIEPEIKLDVFSGGDPVNEYFDALNQRYESSVDPCLTSR